MAETEGGEQDEYFAELIGFLQDKKLEVQRLAAEGLLDQTESAELIEYCQRKPRKIARELLRLAERAEAASAKSDEGRDGEASRGKQEQAAQMELVEAAGAGAAALKALVNLTTIPAVCNELVDMSAGRRCCEALRGGWLEGRSGLAHWYSMLLANLSSTSTGQKALCAEEAHLRFLFAAFVSKSRPPPRDGFDDPMLCLGKVLNNVCALKEGRLVFAGGESGAATLRMLAAELGDRQRRADVTSAFRNLCLDEECHAAVVGTDLLARLARFVYPWTQALPEKRAELPSSLQEVLEADGAALTGDVSVRLASAHCILGLCRTEMGRAYLRKEGGAEVLSAWQTEEVDEDTRTALDTALSLVQRSEEDLKGAEGQQLIPVVVADTAADVPSPDAPAARSDDPDN